MKILAMLFLLVFVFACSLDTKSGIWNEKKVINQKSTLSLEGLNQDLTFDEYKLIIIEYGKKSKFPEINVK